MSDIKRVIKIIEALNEKKVKASRLSWVQYTSGYDFGIKENYEEMLEFMKDKDNFSIIKEHLELELNEVDQRRVELVYNSFENYHKSEEVNQFQLKIQDKVTELSKILNTYRFKLDGNEVTAVELAQILNSNDNRDYRKKAYLAKNQINKPMIEAGFLELIEMRKELARLNGFDSFVEYKLDEEELEASLFDGWKEQVNALLPQMNEVRSKYAKKYLNDSIIHPWDEQYIEAQIAPSLSKAVNMLQYYPHIAKLFEKFGFKLDDYNITYDIFSRANKSEWGYNFPIETAKDSRILANVKDKYYEYGVLLHESGHGVHSFLKNPEEVILNSGISGIITEGIANLFGGLIYEEIFFKDFFDSDGEKAQKEFEEIKVWKKMNSLRAVSRILFDQTFYKTNNKSLEDVYDMFWEIEHEVLGTKRGDYEVPWAFLIHHTTHPIYLHNYFMGDVTCEMLISSFNSRYGTKSITENPKAFGEFLYEEVIKPSGRYTYSALFEKISGDKFSLKYLS